MTPRYDNAFVVSVGRCLWRIQRRPGTDISDSRAGVRIIQYENRLLYHQYIISTDDDGNGVQSASKRATAKEENRCAHDAQTKIGPMASAAAFILLNTCKLR
ncbi:uncharacterized protein LOC105195721 [Solenopsis invicta]|uniref:uncharacterized protein LOC105195721 n=1 Tax=Solenopsis invicta TaxID=13686 RepID=UPI000E33F878|nr:uncharacterized protein LOC105195721 [Solenopsis invicta]